MRGVRDYLRGMAAQSRNVWMFLLAALLMGTGRQIFQVLRNQYLNDLGLRGEDLTSVQAFNALGALLIAFPAIAIVGRFGARPLLLVIALVNAAAYATQGLVGDLEVFRSAAFCAGLAMGLNVALGAPFLMRNSSTAERVFAFSLQSAVSWPLSGLVGSSLAGWLVRTGAGLNERGVLLAGEAANLAGYRFALIAAAGIVLLGSAPILLIREDKCPEQSRKLADLMRLHNKARLFALGLPEMVIGLGAGLTIPFFNVYFQNEWKLGPEQIAPIFTVMFAVLSVSYLLAPPLIKRFGPVQLIIATQILSLPFFIELLLGNALVLAIGAFIARQTLMNLSDPVYRQFSQEVADPRDRNSVAIVVHTSRQMFFVAGNFISGYLISAAGGRFTHVIGTTIGLYVVAIIIELILLPRLDRVRRYNAALETRAESALTARDAS